MSTDDLQRELRASLGPQPQIPQGLGGPRDFAPPRELRHALDKIDELAPCRSPRVNVVWDAGPQRGMPIKMYCAEPLCLQAGECTGPRFVPTLDQWTYEDPQSPIRRRRKVSLQEAVRGAQLAAQKAAAVTGVADTRDPETIAKHIRATIGKAIVAVKGRGRWSR